MLFVGLYLVLEDEAIQELYTLAKIHGFGVKRSVRGGYKLVK